LAHLVFELQTTSYMPAVIKKVKPWCRLIYVHLFSNLITCPPPHQYDIIVRNSEVAMISVHAMLGL